MENPVNETFSEDRKYRMKAGAFLATVAGISTLAGFGRTIMTAKKSDPGFFDKGVTGGLGMTDTGANLAMRALGWGTLYAILGTGTICFGIWKFSGASNLKEFRENIGKAFPKIPRNDPPTSRTEFEGLTDLMTYLSTWGKN